MVEPAFATSFIPLRLPAGTQVRRQGIHPTLDWQALDLPAVHEAQTIAETIKPEVMRTEAAGRLGKGESGSFDEPTNVKYFLGAAFLRKNIAPAYRHVASPDDLPKDERDLFSLIVRGWKNEDMAHKLGWSASKVNRISHRMLENLGQKEVKRNQFIVESYDWGWVLPHANIVKRLKIFITERLSPEECRVLESAIRGNFVAEAIQYDLGTLTVPTVNSHIRNINAKLHSDLGDEFEGYHLTFWLVVAIMRSTRQLPVGYPIDDSEDTGLGKIMRIDSTAEPILKTAEALKEILAWIDQRAFDYWDVTTEKRIASWDKEFEKPGLLYFLVNQASEITGYAWVSNFERQLVQLPFLTTAKRPEAKGRGKLLLPSVMKDLSLMGFKKLRFEATRPALSFYHHVLSRIVEYKTKDVTDITVYLESLGKLPADAIQEQVEFENSIESRRSFVATTLENLPPGHYSLGVPGATHPFEKLASGQWSDPNLEHNLIFPLIFNNRFSLIDSESNIVIDPPAYSEKRRVRKGPSAMGAVRSRRKIGFRALPDRGA